MKDLFISSTAFAFRLMILLLSIVVLIITGVLGKRGKTYSLSFVAATVSILSDFPIIFLVCGRPNRLPRVPSAICSLANCLVAGILIMAGLVQLLSKTKLIEEMAHILTKTDANIQFTVAGLFVGLAILDCFGGCGVMSERQREYGSRMNV